MTNDFIVSKVELDSWINESAPGLPSIPGIDPIPLLKALCMQESSYGKNAVPRHEDGWCPNKQGKDWRMSHLSVITRHQTWGCLSCMSYGPLQALYHSLCDSALCADPRALLSPRFAFDKSVLMLIRKILRDRPRTVRAVADLWNSGSSLDKFQPIDYMSSVSNYYNVFLG